MVREIVCVQVGQCGNQIGNVFWENICSEHSIDCGSGKFTANPSLKSSQVMLEKMSVYFSQTSSHRYVPRCILVDLEPGVLDSLRSRPIGALFKPDNFIFGANGGANNWAITHYQEGPELIDEICEVIRRSFEACDCPQGFQLTQSLGGGTGSGCGSLILLKMREHYPDRMISTYSVFPSKKVSDVVVEPYNSILTMPILTQDCDQCTVIDNEALFDISQNILKQDSPKFPQLNWVISLVMSGCTSSLRFPGKLNGDLRKMGVNLVPFPRLHFFTVAAAPLFSQSSLAETSHVNLSIREVLDQLWSGKNFLAVTDRKSGKYLATSCLYRGEDIRMSEVENEQSQIQDKLQEDFVNWIPNNIMSSVVNVSPKHSELSGSFVANFTGINSVFRRISKQFMKMFKKKAFLHWYIGVGMDELEIRESNQNVMDLINEYNDKQDCIVDEEDPYDQGLNNHSDGELIGDDSDDNANDDDDGMIHDEDDDGIIHDDGDGDDSDDYAIITD